MSAPGQTHNLDETLIACAGTLMTLPDLSCRFFRLILRIGLPRLVIYRTAPTNSPLVRWTWARWRGGCGIFNSPRHFHVRSNGQSANHRSSWWGFRSVPPSARSRYPFYFSALCQTGLSGDRQNGLDVVCTAGGWIPTRKRCFERYMVSKMVTSSRQYQRCQLAQPSSEEIRLTPPRDPPPPPDAPNSRAPPDPLGSAVGTDHHSSHCWRRSRQID